MLIIKCAACKKKLWKYDKIGPGEVLRCHKKRITQYYHTTKQEGTISCKCGRVIGVEKDGHYKMIGKSFTYSGTKRNQ